MLSSKWTDAGLSMALGYMWVFVTSLMLFLTLVWLVTIVLAMSVFEWTIVLVLIMSLTISVFDLTIVLLSRIELMIMVFELMWVVCLTAALFLMMVLVVMLVLGRMS